VVINDTDYRHIKKILNALLYGPLNGDDRDLDANQLRRSIKLVKEMITKMERRARRDGK